MTVMATNDNVKTYTNAAEITKYWIDHVAPRYFNMDNVNTYRAGTLGLNLDILSTVTEDTAHAMMLARREFYPNTAQYMKSLYKIAAAQFLSAPMAKPATANILLLIQQSDILKYGTTDGDLHTFVLDDTFVAYVDNIPFMLDYPIQILSVKKENGKYAHTTHYDFYINNSLSADNERYLPNKVINYKGTEYLIISTTMRQIQKTYLNQLVTSNTIVNTITMDFTFDGTLANFEIFYTENDNSTRVQLEKRLADSGISKKPFCWYTIVDGNTIRITFPANVYFTPKMNSTISIEIATTLGTGGNFDSYESDIVSENLSVRYPYNAQVPIFGTVDGASTGGEDIIDKEDYRLEVMRAFCTNKAFITVNDLQLYFNELMIGTEDKFKFTPKRDDAFIRLYGAFILMKDEGDNVIPTNTLDVILDPLEEAADFDIYSEAVGRYIIKPGSLFTYSHDVDGKYRLKRIHDAKLSDDISKYDNVNGLWKCSQCGYIYEADDETFRNLGDEYVCPKCDAPKSAFQNDRFIFTNPYLISVSTDTFIAGYFMNSFTAHHSLSYTAVNDDSIVQFIAKHFKVERNAIAGENFYKFSVAISPSVDTINQETIFEEREGTIVAKHNGYVESIAHNGTAVYATVKYTDDPALTGAIPEDESTEVVQISSYLKKVNQNFYVCPSCGAKVTVEEWEAKHEAGEFLDAEGNPIQCEHCVETEQEYISSYEKYELKYIDYEYYPGYDFKFAIGDKITKNDVLASAKPNDLGRIRIVMDLNGVMDSAAKRYVPMTLEEAHQESTTYYLFTAYIATDDMIDSSHIIQIQDGFAMQNGDDGHEYPISIPIEGIPMKLHAFYQYREDDDLGDDVKNPEHAYSSFNYLMGYTFTNTYELFEQDSITLVKPLDNVKGFLDEIEKPQPEPEPEPEPEPDPNHPPGESTEIPDDWEHTVYLRTYDHNRFMTMEVDDDRVPNRYLTVDKTPEQMGGSSSISTKTENEVSSDVGESQASGDTVTPYGDNFVFYLRNCPVVSANWIKDAANEALLMDKLNRYYAEIETIIWDLENSFAIDMKFYNTYGKSKFYKIGNNDALEILDSVNIWISFGVGINFPASADVFRDNFRTFVQGYIEATDDMVGNGINIYIMNLIAQAKTNFDEIAWLEYYGINNYGYDAQKLTIMSDDEILETVPADSFVPEFLNIIRETTTDGSTRPMVNIKILN